MWPLDHSRGSCSLRRGGLGVSSRRTSVWRQAVSAFSQYSGPVLLSANCRIDSAPRSASVTALRDSKLSFVDRAAFEAFGQSTPELYRHITTLLARRLRDTNEALVATNFLS